MLHPPQPPNLQQASPATAATLKGVAFTLTLPAAWSAKNETPRGMDFKLLNVYFNDRVMMGVYEGNFSQFGKEVKDLPPILDVKLGSLTAKVYRRISSNGSRSADFLIQTLREEWPTEIHIWYSDLEPKDAEAVESCLQTIRLEPEKKSAGK